MKRGRRRATRGPKTARAISAALSPTVNFPESASDRRMRRYVRRLGPCLFTVLAAVSIASEVARKNSARKSVARDRFKLPCGHWWRGDRYGSMLECRRCGTVGHY